MQALRQACALNNMGVSLLMHGEVSKCVSSLQRSLSALKQAALILEQSEDDFMLQEGSRLSTSSPVAIFPADIYRTPSVLLEQDESLVLYQPFLWETVGDACDDELSANVSKYSAVVLFNLALAFHHQGKQGRGNVLQRAMSLYRMSLQLIEEECEKDQNGLVSLVAVVAWNNIAHCHFELCDYLMSQKCATEMTRLLSGNFVMDKIEDTLHPSLVEALLLNSTMICENIPTAAHAA